MFATEVVTKRIQFIEPGLIPNVTYSLDDKKVIMKHAYLKKRKLVLIL